MISSLCHATELVPLWLTLPPLSDSADGISGISSPRSQGRFQSPELDKIRSTQGIFREWDRPFPRS